MTSALLFLSGVVILQHMPVLPSMVLTGALSCLMLVLSARRYWALVALIFGFVWAAWMAHARMTDRLEPSLQRQDVVVEGYVQDLPRQFDDRVSFDFMVTLAQPGVPHKLRLNWYKPDTLIKGGQSWRMTVRLKAPHGRVNPGGFDYDAWLLANGIGATGYVRAISLPQRIAGDFSVRRTLTLWRQSVVDTLAQTAPPDLAFLGMIEALAVGSQNRVTPEQWQLFRTTGTLHLLVISGSHISLVAGLMFIAVRKLWARFGSMRHAPYLVAAVASWLGALLYSALAGFSIPVQRAFVMLSVAMLAMVLQRNVSAWRALSLALWAVLLFDPFAVLALGFWLSFLAVAWLIWVSAGRRVMPGYWTSLATTQAAVTLGLAPTLMIFFQQISFVAPLANAFAVPWIGVLLTPICLVTLSLCWLAPQLAGFGLVFADSLFEILWALLSQLADWPFAQITCLKPPWYAPLLALPGVAILLAPKGFPYRYLGLFFLLPGVFVTQERPAQGEVWLTLLDVGQGLASVIQTRHHVMVYDTGSKFSEQTDMGESVLLPFLRYQAIDMVDTLVVSHGDNDHSGGSAALMAAMPVAHVLASSSWPNRPPLAADCLAGQTWSWDGVEFQVLSPDKTAFPKENDNSCVIKISGVNGSVLLTGDIEVAAERWLVERYGSTLASSVMLAPHHGSKTSSSLPFLQAVRPEWVLIPAGFQNRFGFPAASVIERYNLVGAGVLNTAHEGAITLKTKASEGLKIVSERRLHQRYWMINAYEQAPKIE